MLIKVKNFMKSVLPLEMKRLSIILICKAAKDPRFFSLRGWGEVRWEQIFRSKEPSDWHILRGRKENLHCSKHPDRYPTHSLGSFVSGKSPGLSEWIVCPSFVLSVQRKEDTFLSLAFSTSTINILLLGNSNMEVLCKRPRQQMGEKHW